MASKKDVVKRIVMVLGTIFIIILAMIAGFFTLDEVILKDNCKKTIKNYNVEEGKSKVEEVYNLFLPKIEATEIYSEDKLPYCASIDVLYVPKGYSTNRVYKANLNYTNFVETFDNIMNQPSWEKKGTNFSSGPIYCMKSEKEELCLELYIGYKAMESIKDNSTLDLKDKEKDKGLTISTRVTHNIK